MWPLRFTQHCNGVKIQMGEKECSESQQTGKRRQAGEGEKKRERWETFLLVWKMFLTLGLTFSHPAEELPSQDG